MLNVQATFVTTGELPPRYSTGACGVLAGTNTLNEGLLRPRTHGKQASPCCSPDAAAL